MAIIEQTPAEERPFGAFAPKAYLARIIARTRAASDSFLGRKIAYALRRLGRQSPRVRHCVGGAGVDRGDRSRGLGDRLDGQGGDIGPVDRAVLITGLDSRIAPEGEQALSGGDVVWCSVHVGYGTRDRP